MENTLTMKHSFRVEPNDMLSNTIESWEKVAKVRERLITSIMEGLIKGELIEFSYDANTEQMVATLKVEPPEGFSIDKFRGNNR